MENRRGNFTVSASALPFDQKYIPWAWLDFSTLPVVANGGHYQRYVDTVGTTGLVYTNYNSTSGYWPYATNTHGRQALYFLGNGGYFTNAGGQIPTLSQPFTYVEIGQTLSTGSTMCFWSFDHDWTIQESASAYYSSTYVSYNAQSGGEPTGGFAQDTHMHCVATVVNGTAGSKFSKDGGAWTAWATIPNPCDQGVDSISVGSEFQSPTTASHPWYGPILFIAIYPGDFSTNGNVNFISDFTNFCVTNWDANVLGN